MAHARGMQVAMGFEFGVHPPEFFSLMEDGLYWQGTGTLIPDPTHYQAIQILYATLDNIVQTYPDIDWIWLWLNEHSFMGFDTRAALENAPFRKIYDESSTLFEEDTRSVEQRVTGVWALHYIRLAYEYVKKIAPDKKIVMGGWGGSNQLPAILKGLDRGLPRDIVFTCLNPGLGTYPQPEFFREIARHRPFWGMPWLEGDNQLWHYQPRVTVIRDQVKLAADMKMAGVVAIHWRTEETRLNFDCYSRFAQDPADTTNVESIYRNNFKTYCGDAAAVDLTQPFARFDREQWLSSTSSPEYYAYTPDWGRLDSAGRVNLGNLLRSIEQTETKTSGKVFVRNLEWYKANIECALLLDQVGMNLEPAYRLRKDFIEGGLDASTEVERIRSAITGLEEAPLERLFTVYAGRIRSRGELGVLSSMNQKLYNEFQGLKSFVERIGR